MSPRAVVHRPGRLPPIAHGCHLNDQGGRNIGPMEGKPNEQVGYDTSGRKKRRHDKKQNMTFDASGRKIGTGNLLTDFILAP